MSTTALAVVGQRGGVLPSANDWNTMMNMADTLFRSGLLPAHIKNGAAAVAIMQKGREVGVPPMHALQNIYFVKGKATLSAELMHALVIRDVGPGALVVAKTDATACTVRYRREGNEGEFTFTIQDAERAGLTTAPDSMYRKYPGAMLRSRAISGCCRFVFPDIIGGMYTPEEMGAEVDLGPDGEQVVIPARATPVAVDEDGVAHEQEGVRLPWNVAPEQWARFQTEATAKGVEVSPYMTTDEIAGAIRKAGGPPIPGKVTPAAAWEALRHIPRDRVRDPDEEAASHLAAIAGEEPDDPYAGVVGASDEELRANLAQAKLAAE